MHPGLQTAKWSPNFLDPTLNNYRQNQQGDIPPTALPDITTDTLMMGNSAGRQDHPRVHLYQQRRRGQADRVEVETGRSAGLTPRSGPSSAASSGRSRPGGRGRAVDRPKLPFTGGSRRVLRQIW